MCREDSCSPVRACEQHSDGAQSSPDQAYLLLRAAPIEGRFSAVVDIPSSYATLYQPTAIFDFDISPSADGPVRADCGAAAS